MLLANDDRGDAVSVAPSIDGMEAAPASHMGVPFISEAFTMQRRYITVDVFTDRAFGGQSRSRWCSDGRAGLSAAQMQAIRIRIQLFRGTTFVLVAAARSPPTGRSGPYFFYRVHRDTRFRGHPNVGTGLRAWRRRRARPPARLKFEGRRGSRWPV